MSLVEVSAALVIISIAVAGLGSVYVMAVGQWRDTALSIRGQQAGTYIIEEVVRSLQSASSIELNGNNIVAYYKIPDLNIDSTTTFNRSGAALQKNGKTFFPMQGIEPLTQNEILIKDFVLQVPLSSDSLYRLTLTLTLQYNDHEDVLDYSTAFFLRNALSAANSAPETAK
jgi:type II secretory pathway pseudopilin PulG